MSSGTRKTSSPELILLTTHEAALYLGVHPDFLRRDRRATSPRIPVVRLGRRTWRYRRADLDALASQGGEELQWL